MGKSLNLNSVEDTSLYRLDVRSSIYELIEIIDFSLDNCSGLFYKNNKRIMKDEWQLIRAHWVDKTSPAKFMLKTELGFTLREDYFLVYLKFKGILFE